MWDCVRAEQADATARILVLEHDLVETKGVVAEVQAAMEAAEVEFAVTDCGTRSDSDGSDAGVGMVAEGGDAGKETDMVGQGGTDEKTMGEMVAEEFVAMEGGGFSLVSRVASVRDTLDWRTVSMDCGDGGLPWETFSGG